VSLHPADKYPKLTHRPSQGQKGIDERALLTSQRPFSPLVTPSKLAVWTHDPASAHGNPSSLSCALFLTPALAVATAARETAAPRATSRRDPSAQPPWRVSATASAWPSRCRCSVRGVAMATVSWCEASRNYPYNVTWPMATPTLLCVMLWLPTSHALPGVRSCRGNPHSAQVVPCDTSPQPCGRQGPGNGQDQQHMDVFWGETTDGVDVSLSPITPVSPWGARCGPAVLRSGRLLPPPVVRAERSVVMAQAWGRRPATRGMGSLGHAGTPPPVARTIPYRARWLGSGKNKFILHKIL